MKIPKDLSSTAPKSKIIAGQTDEYALLLILIFLDEDFNFIMFLYMIKITNMNILNR
ncbi:hypothetical protein [Methanosarcina siciliae]|uniref:hypothetical protein n=1 Tax=Methanosarcina siciliae TaxID=38027 RepID=UPI0012E07889|nr:hypothetical protein [Methanosarcina siciliae]